MTTASSNQTRLVDDRAIQCHSCLGGLSRLRILQPLVHTFNFLAFLITDISRYFHGITDECIAARMKHSSLNDRLVLDDIDCESCAASKAPVFVVDSLGLNALQRNERRLARPLLAHILVQS
jgi:hypothetical protein